MPIEAIFWLRASYGPKAVQTLVSVSASSNLVLENTAAEKQEALCKGKTSRRTIGKIHRRHAGTMMPRITADLRTNYTVCMQEPGTQHQTRVALGTAKRDTTWSAM